ncbi:MAG: hypothetical protein LBG15_12140 [Dysgonamonadaceae bacterium]|jgi:hypothetical protein|nr:hypothetical protein [Dysgonamonadaceae bacterium]
MKRLIITPIYAIAIITLLMSACKNNKADENTNTQDFAAYFKPEVFNKATSKELEVFVEVNQANINIKSMSVSFPEIQDSPVIVLKQNNNETGNLWSAQIPLPPDPSYIPDGEYNCIFEVFDDKYEIIKKIEIKLPIVSK